MDSYIFRSNDISILVESNNSKIIEDLKLKYQTYFDTNDNFDFKITYLDHCLPLQTSYKSKERNEKDYNYLDFNGDSLTVYFKCYDSTKEDFAKRILTTSLIKVLQKNGYTILHGGCVKNNDRTVIITGEAGSGKTTTLLELLANGYSYIANDRLAVKQTTDGIIVCGIPFSLGIIYNDAQSKIKGNDYTYVDSINKIFIENKDVASMLGVPVKNMGIATDIILCSNNTQTQTENKSIVELLGNNIMYDDCIPEDKKYLNVMFKEYINYNVPTYLNSLKLFNISRNLPLKERLLLFFQEDKANFKEREKLK